MKNGAERISNTLRIQSTIPVLKDLKEKRSKSVFINMTNKTVNKINPGLVITTGFKKEKVGCFTNKGKAPKNMAIAGVGNPMK